MQLALKAGFLFTGVEAPGLRIYEESRAQPVREHALNVRFVFLKVRGGRLCLSKRGNWLGVKLGLAETLREQIPSLCFCPPVLE